jgi:tRNA (cytidine/uridine-2'-O-)-methyltransferase
MQIALFEPDIPQNTGTIIRLCACMGVTLHVIEPCGFPFDDRRMRRSMMDYYDLATIIRHDSWQRFLDFRQEQLHAKLLLLSAHASQCYTEYRFGADDILLLGRESFGVPDYVRNAADVRLNIPMANGARSLNVAMAGAMVLGEGLRQTNQLPR